MTLDLLPGPYLSDRTTLRLGGKAAGEVVVRHEADLDELATLLANHAMRPFVLGEGSNLLAADGDLDVILVCPANDAGAVRVDKQGDIITVRAGAGLRLPGLLGWAQKAGFSGLEGFTGIPGGVGGAIAMNAGSYGTDMSQIVSRVRIWTPHHGLIWKNARECEFGYRHFDPKLPLGGHVIWEVELELHETSQNKVKKKMAQHYAEKQATQPLTAHTAGCVFKNPEGHSAGKLLDEAGLKGCRLGNMAFSDIHANFLVNLGGGTSADAFRLLDEAAQTVKDRFDIELETEVVMLT